MGRKDHRNAISWIGVILAAGLGLGVYLLGFFHGFADEALNILFGNIFRSEHGTDHPAGRHHVGCCRRHGRVVAPTALLLGRPDVAQARGVRTGLLGLIFLFVLAITVTEAAQLVGTLLVLSLAITPAAAAQRLSASSRCGDGALGCVHDGLSEGGLLLSFQFATVRPSMLIVAIKLPVLVVSRFAGPTWWPANGGGLSGCT